MSKVTSAGVIITDGISILICHVTGTKNWDIPKGRMDPGESEIETAIRELREETSIVVSPADLSYLGVHSYKKDKTLSLWVQHVDEMPSTVGLTCVTTFSPKRGGEPRPEMDGYEVVAWDVALSRVPEAMCRVLTNIRGILRDKGIC